MRPLDGLVVLDLTRLLPGAAATMQLASFGAEVIKIEEPGRGDYAREIPPLLDGQGAVFQLVNRGKKSVVLDLKSDAGRAALLRLAGTADVLVESFRPGTAARLGLGYETLAARNPRLIYVSITGYGQQGEWSAMAGHDINYQALSGVLDLNGECGGPPLIPGVPLADLAGGALQAVNGVLLALAAREKTGRGQAVDVSMADGAAWLLSVPLAMLAATGRPPARGESVLTGRYACYHLYEASDGRWLAVGALERKFWVALCRTLGCEQFAEDQFAEDPRRSLVIAELARIFRTRPAREWFERLKLADVCVTPVLNVAEAAEHYALPSGHSVLAPKLSATPGILGGRAPALGQHTAEVLAPISSPPDTESQTGGTSSPRQTTQTNKPPNTFSPA